jgi:hypothetical protein
MKMPRAPAPSRARHTSAATSFKLRPGAALAASQRRASRLNGASALGPRLQGPRRNRRV